MWLNYSQWELCKSVKNTFSTKLALFKHCFYILVLLIESAQLERKRLKSFSCMLFHLHAEIIACFLFVLCCGSTLHTVLLYVMTGTFVCLSHLPADGTQVNDYCLFSKLQKTILFKQEDQPACNIFTTLAFMSYASSAMEQYKYLTELKTLLIVFFFLISGTLRLSQPLLTWNFWISLVETKAHKEIECFSWI